MTTTKKAPKKATEKQIADYVAESQRVHAEQSTQNMPMSKRREYVCRCGNDYGRLIGKPPANDLAAYELGKSVIIGFL